MLPLIDQILATAGCGELPAVRQAIEDACYNQTSFVDAVLDCEDVRERDFLMALAKTLSLPWWEPKEEDKPAEQGLRRLLPAEIALRHRLLPLFTEDPKAEDGAEAAVEPVRTLHLATFDPLNLVAHQRVAASLAMPVIWHVGPRTRIVEGLQKLYGLGADTFEKILRGRADWGAEDLRDEVTVIDEEEDEEASVVRFVNQIIRRGLEQRATDIHVEPQQDRLRIRYRIDGRLEELAVPENIKSLQASVIARLKIMARLDIAEKRLPQDGRINLELDGTGIDVRVATIPSVEGESISLRLLAQQQVTLTRLGLTDTVRPVIDELLKLPNGIILITGPTGSGKSTTLASMIDFINATSRRNIVTVEEPIEFVHHNKKSIIVHREVGEHTETFGDALRGAMRADPDIILVGEMRHIDTMRLTLRCASMGMLVFATLHTNNAPKTIDRIIDSFPADEQNQIRVLLASCLRGIVSQLLCKKITGGRVAVHEILLPHEALGGTIRSGNIAAIRNIIEGGRGEGMISMDTCLREHLDAGEISAREAYMKATDKALFEKLLGPEGVAALS